jgi:chromosome partitioning protein
MMKTIAIVSQKGGAGKTTLAIHVATAASQAGYAAAILDLDPQATAEAWGQWREEQPPEVIAAKAPTLARTLEKAQTAGAGLIVLDTPPATEGPARAAAQAADLILIPCRLSGFDLHAIQQTAELAKATGKPAFVVFNQTPPSTKTIPSAAREIAEAIGLQVAPVHLAMRRTFQRGADEGKTAQEIEPEGKAAQEIAALWTWIANQVGLSPDKPGNTRRGQA